MLQFVKPLENSLYRCHNPIGFKCLTRLKLESSDLLYHKIKHGFLDAIDRLCISSTAIENTMFISSFTVPTFQV